MSEPPGTPPRSNGDGASPWAPLPHGGAPALGWASTAAAEVPLGVIALFFLRVRHLPSPFPLADRDTADTHMLTWPPPWRWSRERSKPFTSAPHTEMGFVATLGISVVLSTNPRSVWHAALADAAGAGGTAP